MKSWKKNGRIFFPTCHFQMIKKWFQQTNNENKKIDCVYDCCACRYSSHTHTKRILETLKTLKHRHRFPSPSCLYSVIYRICYICAIWKLLYHFIISFHFFGDVGSFQWWSSSMVAVVDDVNCILLCLMMVVVVANWVLVKRIKRKKKWKNEKNQPEINTHTHL